jgi:hypothetical protein
MTAFADAHTGEQISFSTGYLYGRYAQVKSGPVLAWP